MRIITGEYRGRRLHAPVDDKIRPTTDKVKEALFSILTGEIYDSNVLDLFAGTGSLGLEALSRGAKHCWFGDNSRESLRLLKENIAHCQANDKATVLAGDFRKVLGRIQEKMDIILLDPPYNQGMLPDCFEQIEALGILAEGGIVVAEHRREEMLPEQMGNLEKVKERKYGTVVLSIYS